MTEYAEFNNKLITSNCALTIPQHIIPKAQRGTVVLRCIAAPVNGLVVLLCSLQVFACRFFCGAAERTSSHDHDHDDARRYR